MSVEIFGLTYLNYYLSLDVYASFHGSVVLSVCLSKKNFSMVAISKNVSIKSCHISKKNKNGHFIFGFFLDQICPKSIKLANSVNRHLEFQNSSTKGLISMFDISENFTCFISDIG